MTDSPWKPDQALLEQYALGVLPEEEAKKLDVYISESVIEEIDTASLETVDEFVELLRKGITPMPGMDPEADQRLAQRIEERLIQPLSQSRLEQISQNDGCDWSSYFDDAEQIDELGNFTKYRVLKRLGGGGMGVVFLAEDTKTDWRVALKFIRPEYRNSPQVRERFFREGRVMAKLRHPHVVEVIEVDEHDGIPYLAMEYLKGTDLHRFLESSQILSHSQVLLLLLQVAKGLEAIHSAGVIHRDLKPGNILLQEGLDHAKISDFGLAYLEEGVHLTREGVGMGTPGYWSPEQARGEKITHPSSDLYSLGCVAWHLLTGKVPIVGARIEQVAHTLEAHAPHSGQSLSSEDYEMLTNLIARLLQEDPEKRPQSAQEVIDALQDIIKGLEKIKKVDARLEATVSEPRKTLPWKWIAGVSVALMMVAMVWAFGPWSKSSPGDADDVDNRRASKVQPPGVNKGGAAESPNRNPDNVPGVKPRARPIRKSSKFVGHKGEVTALAISPDGSMIASGGVDKIVRLWSTETGKEIRKLEGHERRVTCARFSRGGDRLLSGEIGDDSAVILWDVSTGKKLQTFYEHRSGVRSAAFTEDPNVVVSVDKMSRRYLDVKTGKERQRASHLQAFINDIDVLPGGSFALIGDSDDQLSLYNLETCKPTIQMYPKRTGHGIRQVALDPGRRFALCYCSGTAPRVILVDLKEKKNRNEWRVKRGDGGLIEVEGLALWQEDKLIAFSEGSVLRVYDGRTGTEVATFSGHESPITTCVFLPDGTGVLTASRDGTIRLWPLPERVVTKGDPSDIRKSNVRARFEHGGPVAYLAWSQDGRMLYSVGGEGKTVNVWSVFDENQRKATNKPTATLNVGQLAHCLALSPDGKTLAVGCSDSIVQLWDVERRIKRKTIVGKSGKIVDLAWSPDGKWLVTNGDGVRHKLEVETGESRGTLSETAGTTLRHSIAFTPDGKQLLTFQNRSIVFWHFETAQRAESIDADDSVYLFTVSRDGKLLGANFMRSIRVYDLKSKKVLFAIPAGGLLGADMTFLKDNTVLAIVRHGSPIGSRPVYNKIELWDWRLKKQIKSLNGHIRLVTCLAVSPDGRHLASASEDQTIQIWPLEEELPDTPE